MARRMAAVVVVLVLGVAALVAYWYWTRTPQYALREAARAVDEHDLSKFQTYVDTERLSSRFVDDMLASATEEASKEAFGGLAVGMFMMMRPQMVKAAHDSLERAVETGRFDETETANQKTGPTDAAKPYWRRASGGESGFRRVSYIKKQGKVAVAGLEIYDADLKMPFTVELKLRDLGKHWQIIEVSNIPAVQKAIREGTEKRLAELNAPIRAELARTIDFVQVSGWSHVDGWGIDREAAVRVRIRNQASRPIAKVRFSVAFMVGDSLVGRINCVHEEQIEPGGSDEGVWSKDVNQFDQEDMVLFRAIDRAQAVAEVRSVEFQDGTSLELLTAVGQQRAKPIAG